MELNFFLKSMVEKGASDLFLTSGSPVAMKIEGRLHRMGHTALTPGMVRKVAEELMDAQQRQEFEEEKECNLAITVPDCGRFRVNVFQQRGETALVIRSVKTEIPSLESLGLPEVLRNLICQSRGLVLVVGSTGSGKSTTLAAMIDHRNGAMPGHILTIEDPIEFIHSHRESIVNQREVGTDTRNFHAALKNAMREAPDVILIGEILDTKTMEAAIAFSETGHLCLATLHANNADQAIERILNFFPKSDHENVLMNLALNLRAIVSQRLVKGAEGKRLPAVEIMLNTPMVADLIRRGQTHEIKKAMEDSLSNDMETFDTCLFRLAKEGKITQETALSAADSRDGLALKFRLSDGAMNDGSDPYSSVYS